MRLSESIFTLLGFSMHEVVSNRAAGLVAAAILKTCRTVLVENKGQTVKQPADPLEKRKKKA